MNKELIKEWGENTAYSAKSHYKSADIKKYWSGFLLYINLIFAGLSILEVPFPWVLKIFGIISFGSSILLLLYDSQTGKNTVRLHMSTGDKYLAIHNDLQEVFYSDSPTQKKIDLISEKLNDLTTADKPAIHQTGKWLAKRAIEKKGEMNTWWK